MHNVKATQGIESDHEKINNFGWEFLGEKDSIGIVLLTEVQNWIDNGDIINSYNEWKTTADEGVEHLKPGHKHVPNRPFKGRRPSPRHRNEFQLSTFLHMLPNY